MRGLFRIFDQVMSQDTPIQLLVHQLRHVLMAIVLFAAIALAAIGLWQATELMKRYEVPYVIEGGCHYLALLAFIVDAICFAFFLVFESYKFIREMWFSLNYPGDQS
jgi:uncharacterized membrane protein